MPPPLSKVPVTSGLRHPPPRPCTWGLPTLMALLSLSAKKAGVFLRHFTRREKHGITRSAENSVQGDMPHTASSQEARCQSNTPLHPPSSPLISSRLNYPTSLAPALWNRDMQSLDTNPTHFLTTNVMQEAVQGRNVNGVRNHVAAQAGEDRLEMP